MEEWYSIYGCYTTFFDGVERMNEIYRKNEYETNEAVTRSILIVFGFLLLIGAFCWIGIFDIYPYMINGFILASLVPLLLPVIFVHVLHVNKNWMKYVLITFLGIEVGICYVVFTFQMILIFLIPSIIAAFYLDKRVICYSGIVTGFVIVISHFITGFHLFQPWIEPFLDMKSIMLYGALPRLMQYLLCLVLLCMLSKRFQTFLGGFDRVIQEDRQQMENGADIYEEQLQTILHHLTDREKEVFELLARGYTNTQIAEKLCLSIGTVKNYVSVIYDKIGNRERTNIILKYGHFFKAYDQSNT